MAPTYVQVSLLIVHFFVCQAKKENRLEKYQQSSPQKLKTYGLFRIKVWATVILLAGMDYMYTYEELSCCYITQKEKDKNKTLVHYNIKSKWRLKYNWNCQTNPPKHQNAKRTERRLPELHSSLWSSIEELSGICSNELHPSLHHVTTEFVSIIYPTA